MAGRTSQAGRGRGAPAALGDDGAGSDGSGRGRSGSGASGRGGSRRSGSGRGRADEDSDEHPMPGTNRSTTRGNGRGTGRGTSSTRGQAATRNGRRTAPAPRRPTGSSATRRRRGGSQLTPLGLLVRGLVALWMGLAHGVGWVARAVGRKAATARELDPEHRRDGAGLALIGLAVLLGAAVWFQSAGPVGRWLAQICHTFFGSLSTVLPVLLVVGGVRLMRAEPEMDDEDEQQQHRGRGIVGWTALFVGTAGLMHLAKGSPRDP